MNNLSIIQDYFNFILVGFLVILIISVLLFIYCRKQKDGKIDRKKMKLYGIMMNMSNKHILALSLSLVNYLFIICGLLFYQKVNLIFILIVIILTILPCLLAYKLSNLIFSIMSIIINCFIIFVGNQVYEKMTLHEETNLVIISYLILFLGFIYFTITEFIIVNNIVNCHNILRRKKNNEKEVK